MPTRAESRPAKASPPPGACREWTDSPETPSTITASSPAPAISGATSATHGAGAGALRREGWRIPAIIAVTAERSVATS